MPAQRRRGRPLKRVAAFREKYATDPVFRRKILSNLERAREIAFTKRLPTPHVVTRINPSEHTLAVGLTVAEIRFIHDRLPNGTDATAHGIRQKMLGALLVRDAA